MTSANVSNIAAPAMMANPTVEKTESTDASFSQVLSNTNTMKNQVIKDVNTSDTSTVKQEVDSNESYQASKTDSSVKASKITSSDDSKDTVSPELEEEVKDAFSEFEEKVKKVLEDNLSVSEEDIVSAMDTLNLDFTDLLNPANVSQLVGEITGTEDSISIVIDENLSDTVSQITDAANFMLEETQVEIPVIQNIINTPNGIDVSEMDFNSNLEEIDLEINPEQVANIPDANESEVKTPILNDTNHVNDDVVDKAEPLASQEEISQPIVEVKVENPVDSKEIKVEEKPDATIVVEEETTDNTEESDLTSSDNNSEAMLDSKTEDSKDSGIVFNTSNDNIVQNEFAVSKDEVQTQAHVDTQQIIDQIVEKATTTITKETSTMEMILNPEHLGKVFLQVSEKEGTVKAQIHIQNQEVKEALVNQMGILRDNLEKNGLKVESIEVSVGTHEFEKNLEENMHGEENASEQLEEQASNQRRSRNININELDDMQGLMTEEEELIARMMADEGNTLNYLA